MSKTIHQGRNIKHFREWLHLKQEGLAYELGDDWNQKKVSLLEQKEVIDEAILEQVAKILKVPVEAIQNLTEDGAIHIIANTFQDFKDNAIANANHCSFNPLDKYVEAVEEIKKLNEENRKLYEELLKVEREKNALLERIINK